jgi:plastocyanin
MKRLLLLMLAVFGLVAAAPVSAKTSTITITKAGYVPRTETIATGDAITFTNSDAATHTVILRPRTGFSCNGSLAVRPSGSTTCTFNTVTRYAISDPDNSTTAFRGTITVTRGAPTIALNVTPGVATYGGSITLSGKLASGQANQTVSLLAQECGAASSKTLGTATTTAGGSFTLTTEPTMHTGYHARFRDESSPTVVAKVRPRIALRRLGHRRFAVTVFAAESFSGKAVVLQRFARRPGRWVHVRTVLLRPGSVVGVPLSATMTSSRSFRVRIRSRQFVRAVLTQAQAGSCYLGNRSNMVRS